MFKYSCDKSKEDFCNGTFDDSEFGKLVTTFLTNTETGEVSVATLGFTYNGEILIERFWDVVKTQETVKFEDVMYSG